MLSRANCELYLLRWNTVQQLYSVKLMKCKSLFDALTLKESVWSQVQRLQTGECMWRELQVALQWFVSWSVYSMKGSSCWWSLHYVTHIVIYPFYLVSLNCISFSPHLPLSRSIYSPIIFHFLTSTSWAHLAFWPLLFFLSQFSQWVQWIDKNVNNKISGTQLNWSFTQTVEWQTLRHYFVIFLRDYDTIRRVVENVMETGLYLNKSLCPLSSRLLVIVDGVVWNITTWKKNGNQFKVCSDGS